MHDANTFCIFSDTSGLCAFVKTEEDEPGSELQIVTFNVLDQGWI